MQLAQSCHALQEFNIEHSEVAKTWHKNSNYIAVLSARDHTHLDQIRIACLDLEIKFSDFYEPDLDNRLTSIAIEPSEKSKRLTSLLPLALKKCKIQ